MNLSNGKESMATSTSRGGGWKSGNAVSDQFPAGLRVLVVDDDPTCLMILEKMLRTCLYEVTKCNRAEHALSLLRENKNGFDIVISDVCMPDMDGFKLLECIGLEMDLPVIMMSAVDGTNVVMKGVTHGACDYLIKPVRIEALKNIWQHVVRRKKNDWRELEQSGSFEEGDRTSKPSDNADYSSSAKEGNWKSSEKSKDEDEEAFHKRLLQRPSYRNEKCSEAASSTDRAKVFDNAIGEGGFSTMAANSTSVERHARGEKTINVAGSSLKDATADSTGEELALSVLAGRPSKPRPSDRLAYSALDDEAWNRINEKIDIEYLLDDIAEVTGEACKTHRLPGAQIWSPCNKQRPNYGCRLSDENQNHCYHVWSRVLENFLRDHRIYGFNQACSEHGPLIKGEGVVGKAFATNEPWFSTDISSIPKTDYPLSEYARMFGMHSAVAVPLQIINQYNSTIYHHVYEFFLPLNCTNLEEQTKTVNALILTLEQGVKKIRKTSSLFHCIEFQLILRPVKGLEYCLAYNESSSFPEENLRGPPSDRRLLPEPSYQNNQWPDQTPSIKPAEVFDDAIGQGSSLSMAVNETSHGTGEKTINVPVISLKDATVKGTRGKSNKRDWAWEYCDPIEGNSNGMECSFCGLEIKGGGITRFKSHIYDGDPCKNVKKCKKVPPEDKVEIEKRMKGGYDKRK